MKKLILILIMFLISVPLFAQSLSDLLLLHRDTEFAEAGGNVYTSLSAGAYESSGLALKVSLPPPYTLDKTGAQLDVIHGGTYGTQIFGINGADAGPAFSFTNSTNSGVWWNGSSVIITVEASKKMLFGSINITRVDFVPLDNGTVDLGSPVLAFAEGYVNNVISDSLNVERERSWVADDGEIVLATGVAGFGQAMIGDNQEWAYFRFTSAGVVTLILNSTNVDNADTDGDFCIYDAGSGIAIKNRLGSALTVMINVSYADPTP